MNWLLPPRIDSFKKLKMETGRIGLRPVFLLRFKENLVAVPAAEAVVVAADKSFASLVAPVVIARAVISATDIFMDPVVSVVIVADDAISIPIPIAIPLVGLGIWCACEAQSTTQYSRS
jgi:hypothetical protein